MAFQVMIVDDEAHARINLRLALAPLPDWVTVAECAGASAARAILRDRQVDLLLLDVQMPVESGLELARSLSVQAEPPLIVFVTAHRDHALDAFDVHALDYLVKPVDERRLHRALERARAVLDQRATCATYATCATHATDATDATDATRATCATDATDAIYTRALRQFIDPAPGYWTELIVRSVGRMDRVTLSDVWWMETAGNYVELHLAQRVLLHRTTLTELVRYLDPAAFLRIHRRLLVRRAEVLALQLAPDGSAMVTLRCGQQLPVSERYLAALKSALAGGLARTRNRVAEK